VVAWAHQVFGLQILLASGADDKPTKLLEGGMGLAEGLDELLHCTGLLQGQGNLGLANSFVTSSIQAYFYIR
jgi:hypothetical protein